MWMLKVSGICLGYNLPNNQDWIDSILSSSCCRIDYIPDRYQRPWAFRSQCTEYKPEELTEREDLDSFNANTKSIQNFVLTRADVLVTTLTNCANKTLIDNFRAEFIDGVQRVADLDTLNTVPNYGSHSMLLLGDDQQLQYTVSTSLEDGDEFALQSGTVAICESE